MAGDGMLTEGHLKWIHELEPIIQKSAKREFESLESYCAKLVNNAEAAKHGDNPEENLTQNQEEHQNHDPENIIGRANWAEKATCFAEKLSAVAFSVLTGNTENAQLLLETMDRIMGILNDSTGNQCQVILYCMDVLRWQIGGGVDAKVAEQLSRRWAEIIESNERMATVNFLKGMCGLALTIEENAVKYFYLEATSLDPNCLVWYHHAYRCLRRMRGRGGKKGGPSKQEVDLAKRAYQLCNGEDMVSVVNYGLTLKEFLWTKRRDVRFWRNEYEVYLECKQVFDAPQDDKMRGREIFLELERDYPNDMAVLHKLGNLYRDEGVVQKARDCYSRALEIHPTMVPCIMDYLRLLNDNLHKNAFLRNRAKTEMARVLDRALSPDFVRSDEVNEKLRKEQRLLDNMG